MAHISALQLIDPRIAGIGLRATHYQSLLEQAPPLGFLEVHSENFFCDGGQPLKYLRAFRELYPISIHGVGLSIGSTAPLDTQHLLKLKRLIQIIEPTLVSEHLCWAGAAGRFVNDLLPLPYTQEALNHIVARIQYVQEYLGRQILVENVSSYLQFVETDMPEWEFVVEVVKRSGCRLLLDVNNIYVNAVNHNFNAHAYLAAIQPDSVGEIHLAGFQDRGDILIDTHGSPVSEVVWGLYQDAIKRLGPIPTLMEWDTDIPALEVLLGEAQKATDILSHSRNTSAYAA